MGRAVLLPGRRGLWGASRSLGAPPWGQPLLHPPQRNGLTLRAASGGAPESRGSCRSRQPGSRARSVQHYRVCVRGRGEQPPALSGGGRRSLQRQPRSWAARGRAGGHGGHAADGGGERGLSGRHEPPGARAPRRGNGGAEVRTPAPNRCRVLPRRSPVPVGPGLAAVPPVERRAEWVEGKGEGREERGRGARPGPARPPARENRGEPWSAPARPARRSRLPVRQPPRSRRPPPSLRREPQGE